MFSLKTELYGEKHFSYLNLLGNGLEVILKLLLQVFEQFKK